MRSKRLFAVIVLAAFVSACATRSAPDPTICAAAGAALGAAGGAAIGTDNKSGTDVWAGVGGGAAGAVAGGLAGYGLCWLLQKDEPPPPPPPPPAPRPAPAPPPPPPPPPEVKERIVLRGVNFDFDKATIRPDAAVILDEAARILNQNPGLPVKVEGHTDATGPEVYNQGLSERRAESVKRYLVERGVSSNRLSTVGFGEAQPIADNATRDGRALNRRVELQVQN